MGCTKANTLLCSSYCSIYINLDWYKYQEIRIADSQGIHVTFMWAWFTWFSDLYWVMLFHSVYGIHVALLLIHRVNAHYSAKSKGIHITFSDSQCIHITLQIHSVYTLLCRFTLYIYTLLFRFTVLVYTHYFVDSQCIHITLQ